MASEAHNAGGRHNATMPPEGGIDEREPGISGSDADAEVACLLFACV
jgi:hypothetical protein